MDLVLKNYPKPLYDGARIDVMVKVLDRPAYANIRGEQKLVYILDHGVPCPAPIPLISDQVQIAKQAQVSEAAAKVLKWQLQEATNGAAHAQCSIGLRYLRGDGLPQDKTLARVWLQKSADQGNSEAISGLQKLPKN